MRGFNSRCILVFAAVSLSVQVGAQTTAPAPKIYWNLDFQDSHCTITTGSGGTIGLSFWMTPGDPDPDIYLVGPAKLLPDLGEKADVSVAPSGQVFQAKAGIFEGSSPRVMLLKLRHEFPAAFTGATAINVTASGKKISIPVPGAEKAMSALHACLDEKLREWGMDAKAFNALRKPPTVIEDSPLIGYNDYPKSALQTNEEGQVIARLTVDAQGSVRSCDVLVSSGSKTLDKSTCEHALSKGKFDPAIGPDGKPTAAQRVIGVTFRIAS